MKNKEAFQMFLTLKAIKGVNYKYCEKSIGEFEQVVRRKIWKILQKVNDIG